MLCIKNGTLHTVADPVPFIGDILVKDGVIVKIGSNLPADGCEVIDASGLFVYPGLVEAHAHLGLDGYAVRYEGEDYNEYTESVTPQLDAIDAFNPRDETVREAALGGVTTVATGPGSSNVLGGSFIVVKTLGDRVDDMVLKRRAAMKCAFGENPKFCYKDKEITTRMSTASKLRIILNKTKEYIEKTEAAEAAGDVSKRPAYDEKLEAMAPVVRGEIPLKAHAHRTDDIFTAIRITREFGLKLTLEHCTEGHLISGHLAKEKIPLAIGPSLGHATKYELRHKTFETPGILSKAGCTVSIITDSPVIPQNYLALCAGLAVKSGMDRDEALRAITVNPAKHLGVEGRVGTLEEGKDADVVIAAGDIMALETEIKSVYINGVKV